MIEINLLPEEKRVKMRKAAVVEAKPGMPAPDDIKKAACIALPVIVGALAVVHVYLIIGQIGASMTQNGLKAKMQSFQPMMKNLTGFKSKFDMASQDSKMMQELANKSVPWSKKLNLLSLDLPAGIWINDLAASPRVLSIKCSAVSLDGDQVELINRFLSAIKDDAGFFGDFTNYDLGSVQKRMLGSFEIADFSVTMEVRPR